MMLRVLAAAGGPSGAPAAASTAARSLLAAAAGPGAGARAALLPPALILAGAPSSAPTAPTTTTRAYHKNVVDHYEKPRNVGSFDKSDPNVGTGLVGAPACGDVMKLQIRVDGDGNIEQAVFKTFGCGSAIASSSVATEWVKGRSLDGALEIRNADIARHLSLPPVKLHCSMLAQDAISAAVADVKAKRAAAAAAGAVAGEAAGVAGKQEAAVAQ